MSIAENYDRDHPMSSPVQILLRQASRHLADITPAGLIVRGSGGQGKGTYTPWIGFFDPDETSNPGHGLYVVYIFSADLKSVTLMLNHGVTELRKQLKEASQGSQNELHERLRLSSKKLIGRIPESMLDHWSDPVDLKSDGWRQNAYQAGCVAARRYDAMQLPDEDSLRTDLWHMTGIYQEAIIARHNLAASGQDPMTPGDTPSDLKAPIPSNALIEFRPKSDSDYIAHMKGHRIVKKRRHETLIAEYGTQIQKHGFQAATNVHPRDLLLHHGSKVWLVEAKVVYQGNATNAVRDAIGQLFTYRHFLHSTPPEPHMVALFTESIGQGYVDLLESLSIASVWKTRNGWHGSPSAENDSLIPG
ncbi:DUF3578 domain-containing protein [Streptomonospora sp. S1-112]|uniref:DUF3578 domain-containing protein n=1 Tax=Streptomonospora mangrovi TaxID=2883123 RepID=A0A9X3NKS6_9ACTN|nr:DUF3578 domain-containing protein [Streptomonospora mangrovi]MDA0563634.1 DUF3578 domain-containing protein [Streptomonospora mangrovi]